MATSKSLAMSSRLADELKRRGLTVAESFDASAAKNPLLTLTNALVRIVAEDSIQVNSIGLAQTVFTPHRVQVQIETDATPAELLTVLAEVAAVGAKVEFWSVAPGAKAEATFATAPSATYGDLQYPLMNQQ